MARQRIHNSRAGKSTNSGASWISYSDMMAALLLVFVLIPGVGLWSIWWTTGIPWGISALFCLLRYISWRRRVSQRMNTLTASE